LKELTSLGCSFLSIGFVSFFRVFWKKAPTTGRFCNISSQSDPFPDWKIVRSLDDDLFFGKPRFEMGQDVPLILVEAWAIRIMKKPTLTERSQFQIIVKMLIL